MKNIFIYSDFAFWLLIILLFSAIVVLFIEHKKHSYIFELIKKIDDFSNLQKLAFLLADEAKKLFGAEFVCVVEYTYSKSTFLTSVPSKLSDKTSFSPHEVFFILKTLIGQKIDYISEKDIQSEHIKQYFPLFEHDTYRIISIFNDDLRIITLEIYGKTGKRPSSSFWEKITGVFKKAFYTRITYQEDIRKVSTNETIIRFLDRIRYTLDEDELEKIILEEISHSFEADRAFFIKSLN